MSSRPAEQYLIPPPQLEALPELPPYLGGLRLERFRGERPEEIEPFSSGPLEDAFTSDIAAVVLDEALANEEVRRRLGGTRWHAIGVSRMGHSGRDAGRRFLVVVYDYLANVTVEIEVNEVAHEVVGITEVAYQPPLTEAEVARAIDLARSDSRLAKETIAALEVMTIQIDRQVAAIEANAHRLVEVLFGCRGERVPRYRTLVDLSTDQVLRAGPVERCCGEDPGDE